MPKIYLYCKNLSQRRDVVLCDAVCDDSRHKNTEATRATHRRKCAAYQDYKKRSGFIGAITYYNGKGEPDLKGSRRRVQVLQLIRKPKGRDRATLYRTIDEVYHKAKGVKWGDCVEVVPVGLDDKPMGTETYKVPAHEIKVLSFLKKGKK